MSRPTILLVEDDRDILKANRLALEMEGYRILEAGSLLSAQEIIRRSAPDLVVLDILLPDGNGLDFCRGFRRNGIPVLLLSALGTKQDELAGLRAGGDDYITKPYIMEELLLRVDVLLRRNEPKSIYHYGPLSLDLLSTQATLGGQALPLTQKEFIFLFLLVQKAGGMVEKGEISRHIWGSPAPENLQALYAMVSRLKKKIEPAKDSIALSTVWQQGYYLELL